MTSDKETVYTDLVEASTSVINQLFEDTRVVEIGQVKADQSVVSAVSEPQRLKSRARTMRFNMESEAREYSYCLIEDVDESRDDGLS
ncbi:hypothetical protein [Halococcus salifodinae]|uniref:Uncharacterized protein n=1 Tax=Halococcus salifodinae DSM 8989 TaxID=1227456 RepID=M0N8V4_9EURY|nr:hypothetical protein [Halococcus salifodinae]EMA54402.1 hypothetical protein C450_06215 [Halococcus salifodinae DSM 8989]